MMSAGESLPRVLVVDDDEAVCRAIARGLSTRQYDVSLATDGQSAVDLLVSRRVDAIVCDVHMPGMNGLELLKHVQRIAPKSAVIMLSGINDASVAADAMTNGAADYLVKPASASAIAAAIERARGRPGLDRIQAQAVAMVEEMVDAVEAKVHGFRGHSRRVASLAEAIARELGLDERTAADVHLAGRLHEVGKIGVAEAVLNRAGPLSNSERTHVRDHVKVAGRMLTPLDFLGDVAVYVVQHQERWDGGGYPAGRSGEGIALGARILAVADAYDALTSDRPHRSALRSRAAVEEIMGNAGTQFDPRVCEALRTVVHHRSGILHEFRRLAGMLVPTDSDRRSGNTSNALPGSIA